MLELEQALARILSAVPPAKPERIALELAHRRILAERVLTPLDLPPFDNSAMDGYAVQAVSLRGAAADSPVELYLSGRVPAGEGFSGEVLPGQCVRIFTGSPLPRGADAVIMQEDTRTEPARPGVVSFLDSVKPWENVRLQGEDVKCGTSLANQGEALNAGRISLFAAVGLADVQVGKTPLIGILATGSELREAGQPLMPGKIYESNRLMLAALLNSVGVAARIYPIVADSPAETRTALDQALNECDCVITSGGVSVGEMDFVKSAFEQLGGDLQFWKVAIRPGRPFVFGRSGGKLLFGLPGNPVSAFVTCQLLVRPALLRWQGAVDTSLPMASGILAEPLANPGGRRHFMRVLVDAAGRVHSAGAQASHVLSSLAAANGLVDVPPDATLPAGTLVSVMRWE
jgi:molybdopterin molybdotransferase